MDIQLENATSFKNSDSEQNVTNNHKPDVTQHIEEQSPGLLRFIRKQVATVEDAEDILQDVLAQFFGAFEGVEAIEQTASWLFRVAKNRVTDWYRSKKGKNQVSIHIEMDKNHSGDNSVIDAYFDDLTDERSDPETAYWQEVLAEELEDAVSLLPARQQQVFIWHEFNGLSFTDMAQITGETENSLRLQKHYAMKQLRTSLKDYFDQEN